MPIEYNRFPEIIAGIEPGVETALHAACVFIVDGAERRSRVGETGDMKAGWRYEVYAGFTAKVWNEEEYAIYNEFGTKHMSAQPMVRPAVKETEPKFLEALKLAFEV